MAAHEASAGGLDVRGLALTDEPGGPVLVPSGEALATAELADHDELVERTEMMELESGLGLAHTWRLGIMGGTFDPIHIGHLAAASEVMGALALDEVVFVPAGNPCHKTDRYVTAAEHRLTMVQLAVAANPRFTVSRVDVDCDGPTYTVDTLRDLRAEQGGDVELVFITGADVVAQIPTWERADELLAKLDRAIARCEKGSRNRRRLLDRRARLHGRITKNRALHLHHLSNTLAGGFDLIAVEDLNIAGMANKKRRLGRALTDASLGELHRQLAYKTQDRGTTLVAVGRFYPSSKTCSGCQSVKAKLALHERVFTCDNPRCAMSLDRDINAARNIAREAERLLAQQEQAVAGLRPETRNAVLRPLPLLLAV